MKPANLKEIVRRKASLLTGTARPGRVTQLVPDHIFDDELLLIAEDGANLGLRNLPLAVIAKRKFWVNNHAHILKPKRGNLEYLARFMETLNNQPRISGAAQPKLTKDRIMGIAIAVAPASEQAAIVEYFTEKTAPLRAAIARTEREIALMLEYLSRGFRHCGGADQ